MKKLFTLVLATAVVMVGSLVAPKSAEAVPAFARQVGVSCTACHFQHLPKLNAFGRAFKLGGMTQTSQDLLEDDGLSIGQTLGLGMIIKYRYKKTAEVVDADIATGKERGQWNMPDEIALFIGGRMGEHWGYLTEGAQTGTHNKVIYTTDVSGITAGAIVYSTDGGGPAYSMEIVNNSQRFNRAFENRTEAHAQFALGNGISHGAAVGLSAYASNELFFANVGLYGPGDPGNADVGFGMAKYIRVALTPKVGDGMDVIVGYAMTTGEVTAGVDSTNTGCVDDSGTAADCATKVSTNQIDAQLQMEDVGGMSLEVDFALRTDPADDGLAANEVNVFNSGAEDESAMSIGGDLGIGHNGVKASFLSITSKGGTLDNDYTVLSVGGWYAFAQNVELVLEYSMYSGEDDIIPHKSYMLVMLEAGL